MMSENRQKKQRIKTLQKKLQAGKKIDPKVIAQLAIDRAKSEIKTVTGGR